MTEDKPDPRDPRLQPRGRLSDLVPPALYRAEAILEACARDLEALLPEDWKGVIESQLDEVRAGIRYVQWKIEDAPALILAERADDYQDDR